ATVGIRLPLQASEERVESVRHEVRERHRTRNRLDVLNALAPRSPLDFHGELGTRLDEVALGESAGIRDRQPLVAVEGRGVKPVEPGELLIRRSLELRPLRVHVAAVLAAIDLS